MISRIFITTIIYYCGITAVRSSKNSKELPQNTIESYMKTGIFGETVEEIQRNFFKFTMIIGYILLIANTIQLIYYIVSDFL